MVYSAGGGMVSWGAATTQLTKTDEVRAQVAEMFIRLATGLFTGGTKDGRKSRGKARFGF